MKCKQCGTEFEGKFCPQCGTKAEAEMPVTPPSVQQQTEQQTYQQTQPQNYQQTEQQNFQQTQPQNYQQTEQQAYQQTQPINYQPPQAQTPFKPAKEKKPIYKQWWFYAIIAAAVILVVIICVCSGGKGGEKIVWDDMVLGDMLPEPPADKGYIYTNSEEELWVEIYDLSEKQYSDYVDACEEKGFTLDADSGSNSFYAYDDEGYKLTLSYYDDLSIQLNAPMEMSTISWPTGAAGQQLPAPKSKTGKFIYEYDDNFCVYIGDTSKADYDEYVNACSQKGFNADYDKGNDYYYAYNGGGWYLTLKYEGNNIMSITINPPVDGVKSDDTTAPTTEEPTTEKSTTEKPTEKSTEKQTEKSKSNVSTGKINALASAKSYLEYSEFSYQGLIEQLEFEKYSHEEAVYAVDNCGADWKEQALKCAKSYLEHSAFSYQGLVEQLEYEKFTSDEAKYGADNCGADWKEQAAKCAESYLEYSSFSRESLIEQLEYEGFTHEQAVYGVEQNGY